MRRCKLKSNKITTDLRTWEDLSTLEFKLKSEAERKGKRRDLILIKWKTSRFQTTKY